MSARHQLSRRAFLLLLGLAQAIAFASLWVQVQGLVGSAGIRPAARFIEHARAVLGGPSWFELPTFLWWWSGDGALHLLCALGLVGALLTMCSIAPRYALALAWLSYLSLCAVGDVFLGYQWDALLLEATLLAIFYAPGGLRPSWRSARPPSVASIWLLRWLLFRLILLSGWVKLASGDESWRDMTALTYHYWTQPLPNVLAWYAHQLPLWFQKFTALSMFTVELVAPVLIFAPRRFRRCAAAAIAGLMVAITLTGNYGFFTLLTLALCVPLLDDRDLVRCLPRRWRPALDETALSTAPRWRAIVAALLGLALLLPTFTPMLRRMELVRTPPQPLRAIERALGPYRSFNAYGLFAVMTKERLEIHVEGSEDGREWRAYVFRWKPGELERAPASAGPHMPRVDWQMWFAALGSWQQAPWYPAFVLRLLEGSPEVLALLASNPFPDAPPRYVRSTSYRYHFSDFAQRRATGAWWISERVGPFLPTLTLREGELVAVPESALGRER